MVVQALTMHASNSYLEECDFNQMRIWNGTPPLSIPKPNLKSLGQRQRAVEGATHFSCSDRILCQKPHSHLVSENLVSSLSFLTLFPKGDKDLLQQDSFFKLSSPTSETSRNSPEVYLLSMPGKLVSQRETIIAPTSTPSTIPGFHFYLWHRIVLKRSFLPWPYFLWIP